jgi:tetratricopeptide (TPR) repeat protein
METVNRLERTSNGAPVDPRAELARSEVQAARGELAVAAETAQRGIATARARGADLLVAKGLVSLTHIYSRNGNCDKVPALVAEGERIFTRVDQRQGITQLKKEWARCLHYQADTEGSLRVLEEILKTCEEIGARRCVASAHNNMGVDYEAMGKSDEELFHMEKALAIYREINDRPLSGHTLVNVAVAYLDRGDTAKARRLADESLALLKVTNARLFYNDAQRSTAFVLAHIGDLKAAKEVGDPGLALAHELGEKRTEADLYAIRGLILIYGGQLAEARDAIVQSQRLYAELQDGHGVTLGETRMALLEYEAGDLKAAEAGARAALAHMQKLSADAGVRSELPLTEELLARILRAGGQVGAARAELDRALANSELLTFEGTRLMWIGKGRQLAAEGRLEEGLRLLARARDDAARAPFPSIEMEARRAMVEVRLAARASRGLDAAVRAEARQLQADAAKLGYGRSHTRWRR